MGALDIAVPARQLVERDGVPEIGNRATPGRKLAPNLHAYHDGGHDGREWGHAAILLSGPHMREKERICEEGVEPCYKRDRYFRPACTPDKILDRRGGR